MKLIIIAALVLGLSACNPSPTDLHSCMTAAAQAPTERGASIASAACRAKFEQPWEIDWDKGVMTPPAAQ
jgi:hypothetical protein